MSQKDQKPKKALAYLPLEPYQARYTELMSAKDGWTERALSRSFAIKRIEPAEGASSTVIQSGRVLDSVNRPLWALEQVKLLLTQTVDGKVFAEDFFHPGIEALAYARPNQYQLYSFCWAQSFDRFDFTREMGWMRAYESMMLSVAEKTFVASPLLQELILTAFPQLTEQQVPFVGLPFDSAAVRPIFSTEFQPELHDVVYASRFDKEKQPGFFLNLVEKLPTLKFAVCTGHPELKGTDRVAIERAKTLADAGRLTIFSDLKKPEYYSVLKASKVQFNCSLQDWVSFTLLEALTHGCIPCYPRYRDFQNVFDNASDYLYTAWKIDEAAELVAMLVATPREAHNKVREQILGFHDGTYDRIAEHIYL